MKKGCLQKLVAEFIGTFLLTAGVGASIVATSAPIATPIVAALTLGIMVYVIGGVSGCHINPAITLGLLANKKIDLKCAIPYIIIQLLAAFLAGLFISQFVGGLNVGLGGDTHTMLAEIVGTFIFGFGVASAVAGKNTASASGIVVGGSLLLGILMAAALGSKGGLNPAVALGIGAHSPAYFIGPIIGSILGMLTYRFLICGKCCDGEHCDKK